MNSMTRMLSAATVVLAACAAPATAPQPLGTVTGSNCLDCGTVAAIQPVKTGGGATGAGAVMGAVIGGIVGHQFGSGRGNDAATAAGAVGGAAAGHQMEKSARGATVYRVIIHMDAGGSRQIDVADLNGLAKGQRVRVVGSNIQLAG